MIEKLDRRLRQERDSGFTISEPVSIGEMQEKLNELVDAVNNQQIQLNNHECRLLDLQNQINEHDQEIDDCAAISKMENVQDKFAEQRKWIGKLCRFWNFKDGAIDIGILKAVDNLKPTIPYVNDLDCSYAFCEPVKPDDDIIYKGGDNE